jgi:hypothetical protein
MRRTVDRYNWRFDVGFYVGRREIAEEAVNNFK